VPALLVLLLVTAIWGVTFVQVKDAVAVYPLFAFLALRFAIATATLAPAAAGRVRGLGRGGGGAAVFLGALLAAGYALQTAGLQRTTVSSTGFVTGMYVVLTPLIALAVFRLRIPAAAWGGVAGWRSSPASTAARSPATCSCLPRRRSTRSRSC
jgi:drug/metabolite transporter (DMT)-like permease